MITATPGTPLHYWCTLVSRMKPGERFAVDVRELLDDISGYEHNGATFTPADRIIGTIVGSAYTHSYVMSPDGEQVVFSRHEETGRRHYEAPDRRTILQTRW